MQDTKYKLELNLASGEETINQIESKLDEMRKLITLTDEKFFNLMIAITEGINNAIYHGNKYNYSKKILFRIEASDNEIEVFIQDEGKGFNPEEVPDPREPENIIKNSGRGIFIIKALMNDVKFDFSDGTKLTFKFKL